MSDPKPLASLSPQLLARKGGARPAMRPAMSALAVQPANAQEDDLGWNDMGEPSAGAEVLPLYQAAPQAASVPVVAIVPPVVRQQRELIGKLAAERRPALAAGRRAAFTLRLDAERHLRLKLACTIKGRSAQALVTEALDRLLSEIPDAAEIASKLAKTHN